MVTELEETLLRCERTVSGLVSVSGPSRVLHPDKLINLADLDESVLGAVFFAVAFSPKRRQELAAIANDAKLVPGVPLIDPTSAVASSARIGDGTYINALVTVGSSSFLGEHVMINRAASVGHHCFLADFVSVGPGAVLAGNSRVGERTVIGVGAIIYPDIKIGAKCIIAGGAVVRKSVPDGTLVSGHPAVAKKYNTSRSLFDRTNQE
jgi:hypothetical protein